MFTIRRLSTLLPRELLLSNLNSNTCPWLYPLTKSGLKVSVSHKLTGVKIGTNRKSFLLRGVIWIYFIIWQPMIGNYWHYFLNSLENSNFSRWRDVTFNAWRLQAGPRFASPPPLPMPTLCTSRSCTPMLSAHTQWTVCLVCEMVFRELTPLS